MPAGSRIQNFFEDYLGQVFTCYSRARACIQCRQAELAKSLLARARLVYPTLDMQQPEYGDWAK
jgi:hypothetical protein